MTSFGGLLFQFFSKYIHKCDSVKKIHTVFKVFTQVEIASDWRQFYWYLLTLATLLSVTIGTIVAILDFQNKHTEVLRKNQEFENTSQFVATHLLGYDFYSIRSISETLLSQHEVISVEVIDDNGYLVFSSKPEKDSYGDVEYFEYSLHAYKNEKWQNLGVMKIEFYTESITIIILRSLGIMVLVFIIIFLPALYITSFYTTRYIVNPLKKLTAAVEETVNSGYPVKTDFDDITHLGKFAANFNDMQERLNIVQKDLNASLKKLKQQERINFNQKNMLEKVLDGVGKTVSHFGADGRVINVNIGRKNGSIFEDIPAKAFVVAKDIITSLKTNDKSFMKVSQRETHDTDSNLLYDIEFEKRDLTIKRIKAIDLEEGGLAIVTTDITKSRHLERSLHQAQKMRSLGDLTSGVAHDFNNILAIVSGSLEILRENIKDNNSSKKQISVAIHATERAVSVVQSLLAFSRQKPVDMSIVSVKSIVDRMANILRGSTGPGICLKFQYSTQKLTLVDEGMLETAILNLVVNARDEMPDGGEVLINVCNTSNKKIKASKLSLQKSYVSIEVSDTGPGIPLDIFNRLLDPFFTTKPIGSGTGLGLPLVYGFAEQMGGTLVFENRKSGGAIFTLILPVTTQIKDKNIAPKYSLKIGFKRPKNILIVDDELALANILAVVIKRNKMNSKVAGSVGEAISMINSSQENPFDLVVTDLNLPDGDGFDIVNAVNEVLKDTPVLLMSGNADYGSHAPENFALFHKVLEKPLKLNEFISAIYSAAN